MVNKLPILTYTVQVYGFNLPIFKLLQHGSTVVGIFAIIAYMCYRTAKHSHNDGDNIRTKQKVIYWSCIAILAILLFCLWHLIDQISIDLYGMIVVRIIDSVLISLFVVSLYFDHFHTSKVVKPGGV